MIAFDFQLVSVTLQQIIAAALSILEHPTRFLAAWEPPYKRKIPSIYSQGTYLTSADFSIL